jgi:hypothetical protein
VNNSLLDIVHPSKELNEQIMMVRIDFWVEEYKEKYPDRVLDQEDIVSFCMAYTNDESLSVEYSMRYNDYYESQFNECSDCKKICIDVPICHCVNTGKCTGTCKHE